MISDTHFGLSSSTLKDPKKVDQLMQEISIFGNGCDEVVLLGDIFDLWRVRPEKAIRDSVCLLKSLYDMDLRIRYVVGNHDHHLVVLNQEGEFMERMARGDLYPVYVPSLRWRQIINGLEIEMFYPTYKTRCCHRTFLCTHGHHLGGVQAISMQVMGGLRRLSGEELLPADLEMMMTYAYESIYRSAYIGEMVNLENCLWNFSGLLQWIMAGVFKRYSFISVERQYEAILGFLRDHNLGRVDCFIYGDTHQAGIYQRKGGPLAMNAGSFMRESKKSSCLKTSDTYLIINEEGLALRQLGQMTPLYLCELS
ncbi:MAG: metallophosphoesterase [Methanothrix sp.]|nr:metallophosphoesterase [Methanothrix sp.]